MIHFSKSDTIRTYSGTMVDVFNATPDMILIEDIANSLANQQRFGGHLEAGMHYSVAQHSVLCAERASKENKLTALLHDATEAYLLDMPSPIKRQMPEYKTIEDALMVVIAKKFGIQFPFVKEIKEIDQELMQREWDQLVMRIPATEDVIVPLPAALAKQLFLDTFRLLTNG